MDGGGWGLPVRVIVSQERPMAAILPDLLANRGPLLPIQMNLSLGTYPNCAMLAFHVHKCQAKTVCHLHQTNKY